MLIARYQAWSIFQNHTCTQSPPQPAQLRKHNLTITGGYVEQVLLSKFLKLVSKSQETLTL